MARGATLSFICDKHYCSPVSAYPGAHDAFGANKNGPPFMAPVCGISAPKVYPQLLLPAIAVRAYRTFSPLPRFQPLPLQEEGGRGGNFLWHCLLAALQPLPGR